MIIYCPECLQNNKLVRLTEMMPEPDNAVGPMHIIDRDDVCVYYIHIDRKCFSCGKEFFTNDPIYRRIKI
jgi:hypothetical protein